MGTADAAPGRVEGVQPADTCRNKVLLHRETIDDAVGGILAGYLVWSGMVEQPVLAVAVVQEILKRPLGPEGRNLVPGAGLP